MSDLISRSATLEILRQAKRDRPLDSDRWVISDIANKVCKLPEPSVGLERKKGRWIFYKSPDKYHCGLVKCPFCFTEGIAEADEYNFCPNCGAELRGGEDE